MSSLLPEGLVCVLGNDEVIGVDDRDVLIVVECSVEAIREEVREE